MAYFDPFPQRDERFFQSPPSSTDVLIVGAGPVGLFTAYLLARVSVSSVVIERRSHRLGQPKAHAINARSLEVFRQAGLDTELLRRKGVPTSEGDTVRFMTVLSGEEVGTLPYERQDDTVYELTPEPLFNIAQPTLENFLQEHALQSGLVTIHRHQEWVDYHVDEKDDQRGVTTLVSSIRDRDDGDKLYKISSRFVIGADGVNSAVRNKLYPSCRLQPLDPTIRPRQYVSIHFTADLRPYISSEKIAQLYFFVDPSTDHASLIGYGNPSWVYARPLIAGSDEIIETFPPAMCHRMIQTAIGKNVGENGESIQIHSAQIWTTYPAICDVYADPTYHVFLAGDSAHQFPPQGGLGVNTGIADAHNLVWKLSYTMHKQQQKDSRRVLSTYTQERRPVAIANAKQSAVNEGHMRDLDSECVKLIKTNNENCAEAVNANLFRNPESRVRIDQAIEANRDHFDSLGLQLGYKYGEAGVRQGDSRAPGIESTLCSEYHPSFDPGSRLPHAWISPRSRGGKLNTGAIISTLDLVKYDSFTVFRGQCTLESVDQVEFESGIEISIVDISAWDCPNEWLRGAHLDQGVLLVRPDQHILGPFFPLLPIKPAPKNNHSVKVLRRGHQKATGFLKLDCDILRETDVRIPMRDGIVLYADIYRPDVEEDAESPIILAWSPYGKHLNAHGMLAELPDRVGTSQAEESGYEDFEGPDPAFWVKRGYAVVNIDVRGSWNSGGDFYYWGKQTEEDGYDAIEYLAQMPWSNGKVGMAGNSWLAIAQWFIAAGNPPHLAAIAPWEGFTDAYRDQHRRGGISNHVMPTSLGLLVPGNGLLEDAGGMAQRHPIWDRYWDDKQVELSRVNVPAYVVASYSSKIHSAGTFRGFRHISSQEKWLRVHPYQEWYDFATEQEDLAKFFDFYLKGIDNGWKQTPPVRLSLLRFNGPPVINRPETAYPPNQSKQRCLYLDAEKRILVTSRPQNPYQSSYNSENGEEIYFDLVFDRYTELAGYSSVTLHLQCFDHDDLDVFVMLQKLDKEGKVIRHVNFPTSKSFDEFPCINVVQYIGPTGRLRASHRALGDTSPNKLVPGEVYHAHDSENKIKPGDIVPMTIGIWPIGAVYEAGEGLRLLIGGRDACFPEMEHFASEPNENRGRHILHCGPNFDSHLTLPYLE